MEKGALWFIVCYKASEVIRGQAVSLQLLVMVMAVFYGKCINGLADSNDSCECYLLCDAAKLIHDAAEVIPMVTGIPLLIYSKRSCQSECPLPVPANCTY